MPALASTPSGVDAGEFAAACAVIRNHCGWHIAPSVTETLTLDGTGGTILRLPSMHVTEVDTVTNDGADVTTPSWSKNGVIEHYYWTSARRGVEVTLTHGYTSCPDEVLALAKAMAMTGATSRALGVKSQTAGPFSVEYEGTFADAVTSILAPYRVPPSP